MKRQLSRIGFPMLGKELLEQSARKRTYVLRVLYALGLFVAFALFYRDTTRHLVVYGTTVGFDAGLMGIGKRVFEFTVYAQFFGVFLFLPAMMAGVIASEKERDSFSLLLMTDLRPWEILLEKYLGRLIPMFNFLLLAMPLMAIAYALGGVDRGLIWSGIWTLSWCCLQVGAIALMCSAFCRTTVSSIISSYIVGGLFYCSVAIVALIDMVLNDTRHVYWSSDDLVFMFLPPYVFEDAGRKGFNEVVVRSIPIACSTLLFLVLARIFLLRRAFTPARQRMRQLFRWLDARFLSLNKLVGDRMLSRRQGDLPEIAPVAWRELSRRSLGQPHHLLRILMAIMTPLTILVMVMLQAGTFSDMTWRRDQEELSVVMFMLWPLAVLVVAVVSVNAIASERANQTLQVLLTTPVTGRDIVRQKMQSVRRVVMVMAVPLLAWASLEYYVEQPDNTESLLNFVASVSTILIYLPMVAWLGILIGMRIKSRNRAILTVLGTIIGWCVGWIMVVFVFDQWILGVSHEERWLIFSPAVMVILSEMSSIDEIEMGKWSAVLLNAAIYFTVYMAFRYRCLSRAEKWLGRGSS